VNGFAIFRCARRRANRNIRFEELGNLLEIGTSKGDRVLDTAHLPFPRYFVPLAQRNKSLRG
jgi:hypothetical protein